MNANDKPDVTVQVQICTINTDEYFDYFLLMPDFAEDQPWAGYLADDIPEIASEIYDVLCNKALGEHKWTLDLHISYDEWSDYQSGYECDMEYSYDIVKLETCDFDAEVRAYKGRNNAPVEESDWDFEPNEDALEDKEGLL